MLENINTIIAIIVGVIAVIGSMLAIHKSHKGQQQAVVSGITDAVRVAISDAAKHEEHRREIAEIRKNFSNLEENVSTQIDAVESQIGDMRETLKGMDKRLTAIFEKVVSGVKP